MKFGWDLLIQFVYKSALFVAHSKCVESIFQMVLDYNVSHDHLDGPWLSQDHINLSLSLSRYFAQYLVFYMATWQKITRSL